MQALLIVLAIGVSMTIVLSFIYGIAIAALIGTLFIFLVGGPILWGWADED